LSNAQYSLGVLEAEFLRYEEWEQDEIAGLRTVLRELIQQYGGPAKMAILAVGFEIAISERQ